MARPFPASIRPGSPNTISRKQPAHPSIDVSYSKEDKARVLAAVVTGMPITAASREYGPGISTIKHWLTELKDRPPTSRAILRESLYDAYFEGGITPSQARAGRLLVRLLQLEWIVDFAPDVDALDELLGVNRLDLDNGEPE